MMGFVGLHGGFCKRRISVRASVAEKDHVRAIKICGLASGEDARLVTSVTSRIMSQETKLLLGMILWPRSKRHVGIEVAKEISEVAKEAGAGMVGVFVDEDASQMMTMKEQIGLDYVQLHGSKARRSYVLLPGDVKKIFVVDVNADGSYDVDQDLSEDDLVLFDSKGGGTGRAFDWDRFQPPQTRAWLLAGGLSEKNIEEAILGLQPWGVDVASGVSDMGGIRKDPRRLEEFIQKVVDTNKLNR